MAAFSVPPRNRPVRALSGTVADGARAVEVAVLRRAGKRCRALTSVEPAFAKPAACTPRRWLRASGRRAWRLKLRSPLPRGGYVAYVRAVAPGTRPLPFTVRAGNKLAFTVKR